MKNYRVIIKAFTDKGYKRYISEEPISKRTAERVERGVNINLNHDKYYTELEVHEEETEEDQGQQAMTDIMNDHDFHGW